MADNTSNYRFIFPVQGRRTLVFPCFYAVLYALLHGLILSDQQNETLSIYDLRIGYDAVCESHAGTFK